MTIFTTFVSLTDLTTMHAAEISLLAAADGASASRQILFKARSATTPQAMSCQRANTGLVMTHWNTFTKLPRIIVMLIAGAILLTATEGTLAKNSDNAIKNNNVERSGVGKERHKEKGKGAGAGTVTATGNRLVVSPPAYGPPAGGAGGY